MAYGLLENRYDPGLSEDEGLQLAVASLKAALQRDAATGNTIEASIINKDGYKSVGRDRIDEILKTIPEQIY